MYWKVAVRVCTCERAYRSELCEQLRRLAARSQLRDDELRQCGLLLAQILDNLLDHPHPHRAVDNLYD